jgi:hypothetical protein
MRHLCTIYSRDYTFGGGFAQRSVDGPLTRVGSVRVSAPSLREAAARAYVHCVGRERARLMRVQKKAPRRLAAQEANVQAIAASLRRTSGRLGTCYQLDDVAEGWYITVEPFPAPVHSPRRPPRQALSRLLGLLHSPCPN